MKIKKLGLIMSVILALTAVTGCGSKGSSEAVGTQESDAQSADGQEIPEELVLWYTEPELEEYFAKLDRDYTVNVAYDGLSIDED